MADEITPALTPQEWENGIAHIGTNAQMIAIANNAREDGDPGKITHEMLAALFGLLEMDLYDEFANDGDGHVDYWQSGDLSLALKRIKALALAIEAILPPKKK